MKFNRMFEMVYILLNNRAVTAREFAEEFNVSTRTIYRYVEELSLMGIPIYMNKGKNGGISLLEDYTLNKAAFSEEEKLEILSYLKAFENLVGDKNKTGLISNKVSAIFNKNYTDWLEVDFTKWKNKVISKDMFNNIKDAILFRQKLELNYLNLKNENTLRKVKPVKLIYKSMDWYLYGYCEKREDFRFFKLKRIKNLKLLEENFKDEFIVEENLNTEYKYEELESIEVVLEISKELEFYVFEEYEEYRTLENGNYEVVLTVGNINEILPYILSCGSFCKVISPKKIVDILVSDLKKSLNHYENI